VSRMGRSDLTAQDGSLRAGWRKSTLSGADGCVEVRISDRGVEVRDSKDPSSPVLTFTHHEWRAFVGGVRLQEFD
jgi:hypothetical protein